MLRDITGKRKEIGDKRHDLKASISTGSVERGSGDNQGLSPRVIVSKPFGYDFVPRPQASSKAERELEEFLLPTRRKRNPSDEKIREIYTNESLVSSAASEGDGEGFPFEITPSGNLKVSSSKVVYETKKLSVLVSNPQETKIKVVSDEVHEWKMTRQGDWHTKNSAMDALLSQAGISGLGSIIGDTPERESNKVAVEYETKRTHEILDPELSLGRLGYTGMDGIKWANVHLPEKKDLYLEISRRIHNRTNADCKVHIGQQEFSCHLLILQCYSELFNGYTAIKKVEIPPDKCTAKSFEYIYDWMISDESPHKRLDRDNVIDVFNAAKYLRIQDLVEQCWAFIDNTEIFAEDTAFLLYVDSKRKDVEEVQQLMLPRIQDFFLMLVSSQDWLDLDVNDVQCLLRSNYIRVNCEMEVFMAAVRWLKYDPLHRDQYQLDVLSCVRFGNIAPWQLVDIKRNPENPEFMDLARDPALCKMIDDGLAFVIIKYWYGHENDDFRHWNSVLGLKEPPPRNWTGVDKTYFTYREFLIYLDQYRRNQLILKSRLF